MNRPRTVPPGRPPIGGRAGQDLLRITRLIAPLMHPACGLTGDAPDNAYLARVLWACTSLAARDQVVRLHPFRQAVYVLYDYRDVCRYIGSVARTDGGAVAARVGEHYAGPGGMAKTETWERIVVLGLSDNLPVEAVRQIEGRIAFALDPVDGSAHPAFGTGADLASLRPTA